MGFQELLLAILYPNLEPTLKKDGLVQRDKIENTERDLYLYGQLF